MMKNPSFCYKFYWLEAIVNLISEDVTVTTFNDLIDEMISNAWYSVVEFHVNLSGLVEGEVKDGLERAVNELKRLCGLESNASKIEIKNAIKKYDDELKGFKEQLTNMVPYRALAGFFDKFDEKPNWGSQKRLVHYIKQINQHTILPYTLGESTKLNKEVYFDKDWISLIQDNTVSILGWIQYEKVKWLQNNNPEVPGLVYKLAPLDEKMRKLKKVHDLWDSILEQRKIYNVFGKDSINPKKYDVDHFIPWSFVMNDELWNLMPIDKELNNNKKNKLPKWDPFFKKYAFNQYILYEFINDESYPNIREKYKACFRDNLHSIWANQELYRAGNTQEEFYNILEKNMRPVYDSAKRQGYQVWKI
ncbi:MAG: HNH endonuclease [Lachnospiraceae bacterium]|nr:HNH endonuclease [Lachnospiraceae bacterium]